MPADWRSVLAEVADRIDIPLARSQVEWSLAGSAATAVQGCAVVPRDIDLLFKTPGGVDAVASLLQGYALPACDADPGCAVWVSSRPTPVVDDRDPEGFRWHWGRWRVQGFKVEAAHITAPDGRQGAEPGIWENGPEIWILHRLIEFRGHRLRVPPLEVQLATCVRRGLSDRVESILKVLRRDGANRTLLTRSLGDPPTDPVLNRLQVEGTGVPTIGPDQVADR